MKIKQKKRMKVMNRILKIKMSKHNKLKRRIKRPKRKRMKQRLQNNNKFSMRLKLFKKKLDRKLSMYLANTEWTLSF